MSPCCAVRAGAVLLTLALVGISIGQDEPYDSPADRPPIAPRSPEPDLRFGVNDGQAAAAISGPAPQVEELVREIQQAPDPSSTVEAYARALAAAPESTALELAYVRRMVELGAPQLAEMQAADLIERDPQNGLAWAVLAFNSGVKHETSQALEEIATAVRHAPNEAFVQRTAGQLLAWYDEMGDPQAIPADLRAALEHIRAELGPTAIFADAYRAAREYYARTKDEPPLPPEEPAFAPPAGENFPEPPPAEPHDAARSGFVSEEDWDDDWQYEPSDDWDSGSSGSFRFSFRRYSDYPTCFYPRPVEFYCSGAPAWSSVVIVPRRVSTCVYSRPTVSIGFGLHHYDRHVIGCHERVARLVPHGGRRVCTIRGHDTITVARPDRSGRGTRVVSVPRRTLAADPVIRRELDRPGGSLSAYGFRERTRDRARDTRSDATARSPRTRSDEVDHRTPRIRSNNRSATVPAPSGNQRDLRARGSRSERDTGTHRRTPGLSPSRPERDASPGLRTRPTERRDALRLAPGPAPGTRPEGGRIDRRPTPRARPEGGRIERQPAERPVTRQPPPLWGGGRDPGPLPPLFRPGPGSKPVPTAPPGTKPIAVPPGTKPR